jgi:hypothetical protein
MKEKISRNKISRHYKSFFGLENMALAENDNLMIDWGESLINELINQEAEKRIADRMPSDEEITHEATDRYANKITGRVRSNLWAAFRKGAKWSRSRMIKISSSQKTEGGGE